MSKKIKIYKVRDNTENFTLDKGHLFNVSFRLIILAKSGMGKSNLLVNLLCQEDKRLYRDVFEGENIFLFSPSIKNDPKLKTLIKCKKIPDTNLFTDYEPEVLEGLYDMISDEYEEALEENETPSKYLFILDDLSFSGALKDDRKHSIMNKIFCNARHIGVSLITCCQSYVGNSGISTCCRENLTGIIAFKMSERQLDSFTKDHNYLKSDRLFKDTFRDTTNSPHSFFAISYSNPHETMYLDKTFEPLTIKES